MKKRVALLVGIALLGIGLLAGCGSGESGSGNEEKESLTIGLALTGSKSDGGWNQVAYDALVKAQDELGAEIMYQENVTTSDTESVLRNYAKDGCDVVIGHGYQFGDPSMAMAGEFPDTIFLVVSSDVTNNKNVGSINENYYESGFMQGAFAAMMSKNGKIAGLGGMEIPSISQQVVGYEAGAKYIDPNVTVLSAFTGDFVDINKAKEQSITFIEQGADILMMDANIAGRGGYEAATQAPSDVYVISTTINEYDVYPEVIIASGEMNTTMSIYTTLEAIADGSYKTTNELKGVAEGVSTFTINPKLKDKVPEDVQKKIEDIQSQFKDGSMDVMTFIKE